MESGLSSPREDDYAQEVHGQQMDVWEQFSEPNRLRDGQGVIIDTSQRDKQWKRMETTQVYKDDNGNKITADLKPWHTEGFDMGIDPLFPRSVNMPQSRKNATERPRTTTDAPQTAARHDKPNSRTRGRPTLQSPAAAGPRRGSASSNRSFHTATPPSRSGSRSSSRSSSRSGQRTTSTRHTCLLYTSDAADDM
eukprot:522420-Rhodomonas_salina.1